MTDTNAKVREVAWSELFPWLMLLRSVRIALMARVLVLGALGLIATSIGWRALTWTFSGHRDQDPVVHRWYDESGLWIWNRLPGFQFPTSPSSAQEVFWTAARELQEAPLAIWLFFTQPFLDLFDAQLTPLGFLFLLLCCVWELLVWGLAGGAITRIAALRYTRDEAPPFMSALKHAVRKLPSYSVPPLVALGGTAFFAIQLAVLGLLMRLPILNLLAAIIWPFVLLLGLLMAILLLGALVGWPLMWSTVSVEGTDAFDALSRSYAYVYHRPWRLLYYVLFAAVLGIVSMFVVKLFAFSAIALGDWSIDWGLDSRRMAIMVSEGPPMLPPPSPPAVAPLSGPAFTADREQPPVIDERAPTGLELAAGRMIHFWKSLLRAVAAGYQAGFLWASAVGVYLLMRRDIDGVQLNEVYIDPADEYGMPPLADEATTGVAEVVPGQPAVPGDLGPVS